MCPTCQTIQGRSKWSGAQWIGRDPRHGMLNGCKDCRAAPGPCIADERMARLIVVNYLHSLPQEAGATMIADFIENHWLTLPQEYRKKLSHLGAVTSNDVVHPRTWRYGDRLPCFDPGALADGSVIACISMLPCEFCVRRVRSGTVPEARYITAPATFLMFPSAEMHLRVRLSAQHRHI